MLPVATMQKKKPQKGFFLWSLASVFPKICACCTPLLSFVLPTSKWYHNLWILESDFASCRIFCCSTGFNPINHHQHDCWISESTTSRSRLPPAIKSVSLVSSSLTWLRPPMLGTKIMPVGTNWAIMDASCTAPLPIT